MAKIKRITVSSGATINVGNYENLRRDVTLEAELAESEDIDNAFAEMQFEADMQLAASVASLAEEQIRKVSASIVSARDDESRSRRATYESPLFRWLNDFMPDMAADVLREALKAPGDHLSDEDEIEEAQELLDDVVDLMVAKAADPGEEAYDDEDDDEGVTEGFPRDDDDDEDEDGYTGDGFTEQFDDGYPADAHPDEVEYERARATYPDMPPYAEAAAPEELPEDLPFAAEGEDGQAAS